MQPNQIKLRKPRWLLPVLAIFLFVLMLFDSYSGWWVLFFGLGGAWLISYLWARSLARDLDLTREVRFGWAQVGDTLRERFTMTNRSRLPALWVELHDRSNLPSYRASREVAVGGERSIRWHIKAVCTRRGLFHLGPVTVRTGDPLGLFTVVREFPTTIPLLVLPPVATLPPMEMAPGGRSGDEWTLPLQTRPTVTASQVREYVPGDHHRLIHWPTSARQNELYVRSLDSAQSGDWTILLDMDHRVHLGEGENSTEEHQVVLAASLADQALRSGKAVGLAAADGELTWLPPRGGDAQRWQILYSLALISQGDWPLPLVLERTRPLLGRSPSLTIITPSVDPGWIGSLVPILEVGGTLTVLILDPHSFGGSQGAGELREALQSLGVTSHIAPSTLLEEAVGGPKPGGGAEIGAEPWREPRPREPWEAVL